MLRLHPRLFEAIRHWAADDQRSINARIESLPTDLARPAGTLSDRRARRHFLESTAPEEERAASADRPDSLVAAGISRGHRTGR